MSNTFLRYISLMTLVLLIALSGCEKSDDSDDGNLFVVTNFAGDQISILERNKENEGMDKGDDKFETTCRSLNTQSDGPVAVAFGSDRFAIANVNQGNVTILHIDEENDKYVNVDTGAGSKPIAVAYGKGLFGVVEMGDGIHSGQLSLIHPYNNRVVGVVQLGIQPISIAFGNGVFMITNFADDTVTVVDPDNLAETQTIVVGDFPNAIAFGNGLFAVVNRNNPASNNGSVTLINDDLEVVATLNVENNPTAIAFGDSRFAITNHNDNTVTIINAANKSSPFEENTIDVEDGPIAVAYHEGFFGVANSDGSNNNFTLINSSAKNIKSLKTKGEGPCGVGAGNGFFLVADSADSAQTINLIDVDDTKSLQTFNTGLKRPFAVTAQVETVACSGFIAIEAGLVNLTVFNVTASTSPRGVEVRWEDPTDLEIVGFNVWRREKNQNQPIQINKILIMSKKGSGEAKYSFLDDSFLGSGRHSYQVQYLTRDNEEYFLSPVIVD